MLNIGPQELLLILVIALVVVGPRRLPELGRAIGKGIRELRKAQDEVRRTIQVNLDEEERPTFQRRREASRAKEPAGDAERAPSDDVAAAPAESTDDASSPSEVREVSKTLGRGLAELRRAREEIQRSFRVDVESPGPRKRGGEARTKRSATPPAETPPSTTRRSATPRGTEPAANGVEPAGPGDGAAEE